MNCRGKLENNQCRACYNASKGLRLTSLTKCVSKAQQKSYAELITEVSNINIMEDFCKELPQFICSGCSRKLKVAYAFIQQTHAVHERLMAMLAFQDETDKHLDCLQEAQVDIQSYLEIKMEHDDVVTDDEYEGKGLVKSKIEEPVEFLQNNVLDVDVLYEKKSGEDIDLAGVEEKRSDSSSGMNDTEHIKSENIFIRNSSGENEINSNSKRLTGSYQSEGDERDSDTNAVDNDWQSALEWQKDIFLNDSKEEKQNLTKSRKPEGMAAELSDDDVAIPCNLCNKIFSNSKALMRHQRTSHIPEDQKCTCHLCFRKFSRSCNMYTHMRTFHGPDTVPLIRKPSTQERIFQCDKCTRNYTKKKHLNIHIKNKHSQENESSEKNKEKSKDIKIPVDETSAKPNKAKRYEVRSLCSICGSSFSSKTHLIVHMRRHTGERPFKCDLCDRAYPRISELTCHRRIHTGEKPFACKICGKTFRVSSKMTTHMRSHTDIRPYKCTQCDRSFKYSKDLSIHFRIHTGERPYSCNVCGSTFTQSNTLRAHRVKLGHMDNNALANNNNLV